MRPTVRLLMALALVVVLAPAARADDDELLASIYTESGYELRRDERLFALFAAFNVAGFDRAEEPRSVPFARRLFHPIRQSLRDALQPLAEKLRGPVDLFLDTHPQPVEAYEAAALLLGEEPDFRAGDGFPRELAGLDRMLADFAKGAKLQKLGRQLSTDYRTEFKRLRDEVDQPLAKLREGFRLKEEDAPALALLPTPLDGQGFALARRLPDGSHVVLFGLAAEGKLDLQPVLRAYARLLAEEATARVAPDGLREAVDQLKAANVLAADATPASVLADSLRVAVEARLGAKEAAAQVEPAAKRGLLYAREFAKALAEPPEAFPAEKGSFAAQVAARVDPRKAAAELARPPDAGKPTNGRK